MVSSPWGWVVPFAGAWIETHHALAPASSLNTSFPSRERGLKPIQRVILFVIFWSFPSRERGLKLFMPSLSFLFLFVVPFAGAWIETNCYSCQYGVKNPSFPSRERGLKHILRSLHLLRTLVVPFAGAWIETALACAVVASTFVVPFAGAWIETPVLRLIIELLPRRSLRGSVD